MPGIVQALQKRLLSSPMTPWPRSSLALPSGSSKLLARLKVASMPLGSSLEEIITCFLSWEYPRHSSSGMNMSEVRAQEEDSCFPGQEGAAEFSTLWWHQENSMNTS